MLYETASKFRPKNIGTLIKYISAFIVILAPAILAGCRNVNMSIDTSLYVVPTFNALKGVSSVRDILPTIASLKYFDNCNIGFLFVEFLVARLGGDIQWNLFAINIVGGICVFGTFINLKKDLKLWMVEFAYLCLLYNTSFNAIRQVMAICACMYAFSFLLKDEVKKFIVLTIAAAVLLHDTALLSLILLPLYYYIKSKKKQQEGEKIPQAKRYKFLLIALFFLLIILSLHPIVNLIDSMLGTTFSRYWSDHNDSGMSIARLAVYTISTIPMISFRKKIKHGDMLMVVTIIDYIFFILSLNMLYIYRLSLHFMALGKIVGYGEIVKYKHRDNKINLTSVIMLIVCILYWFYTYVYANWHATVPFEWANTFLF